MVMTTSFRILIYNISSLAHVNPMINILRPGQNSRRFTDDTFKRIFLNGNARISIEISLKFDPKGPINNNPALAQIMAWRRSGDESLSEPMMVSLLTHICVTRPQWINVVIRLEREVIIHISRGNWVECYIWYTEAAPGSRHWSTLAKDVTSIYYVEHHKPCHISLPTDALLI